METVRGPALFPKDDVSFSTQPVAQNNPYLKRAQLISSRKFKKIMVAKDAQDNDLTSAASEIIFEVNNSGRMQNVFDLRDLLPNEAAEKTATAITVARQNQWPAFLIIFGSPDLLEDEEADRELESYYSDSIRTSVLNEFIGENVRYAEQPGAVVAGFPIFSSKWTKPKTPGVIEFTKPVVESLLKKCGLPGDVFEAELASIYLNTNEMRQRIVEGAEKLQEPKVKEEPRWQLRQRQMAEKTKKAAREKIQKAKGKQSEQLDEEQRASWWFKLLVLLLIISIISFWGMKAIEILTKA